MGNLATIQQGLILEFFDWLDDTTELTWRYVIGRSCVVQPENSLEIKFMKPCLPLYIPSSLDILNTHHNTLPPLELEKFSRFCSLQKLCVSTKEEKKSCNTSRSQPTSTLVSSLLDCLLSRIFKFFVSRLVIHPSRCISYFLLFSFI